MKRLERNIGWTSKHSGQSYDNIIRQLIDFMNEAIQRVDMMGGR